MARTQFASHWQLECGGLPAARLSARDPERIQRKLKKRPFPNPRDLTQWEMFKTWPVDMVRDHLSSEVIDRMIRFTQDQRQPGFVIDGLPVGELPLTPPDGQRPSDKSAISEAILIALVFFVGEIFSYLEEKEGAPIHEVVPIPGKENSQSNAGRSRFLMHTDDRFLGELFGPDGIILIGLRNDNGVATRIVTLEDIFKVIPLGLLNALRRPAYRLSPPQSFVLDRQYLSPPLPIIWTDRFGIDRVGLPSSGIHPMDAEAEATYLEFRDLVESIEPRLVILRPGRVLCFRNALVLHGRDEIHGDRWAQRAYWKPTIAPLRSLTHSDPREFAFSVYHLLGF